MKKILHITTDNKFIGYALDSFENIYPKQNTVWMIEGSVEIQMSNNIFDLKVSSWQTLSPLLLTKLKNFDLVVLHSFPLNWYFLVLLAPSNTKFAWLGWGYDYYDNIFDDSKCLLLPETLKLDSFCKLQDRNNRGIKKTVKLFIAIVMKKIVKPLALKRISSFSPVLKEDYDLVLNAKNFSSLPPFISWNYGSLEDNFIKNFIGQRVTGSSILVGNSATSTNNHIEVFKLLSQVIKTDDIKIIAPLSYGDECYKHMIMEAGQKMLGSSFNPVSDFMVIDEYVALIKQCGYVIMNHIRQQAVGNIVIMLYLGARVFLREDNPTYLMLKTEGIVLNTIQELEVQPKLMNQPLTEEEIQTNIKILYKHWSKRVIDSKTKNLVEFHLGKQV